MVIISTRLDMALLLIVISTGAPATLVAVSAIVQGSVLVAQSAPGLQPADPSSGAYNEFIPSSWKLPSGLIPSQRSQIVVAPFLTGYSQDG